MFSTALTSVSPLEPPRSRNLAQELTLAVTDGALIHDVDVDYSN
jgi:hypothetical protein